MASSESECSQSGLLGKAPEYLRVFDCPLCEAQSISLPSILEHIRSHARDNPWNCDGCEDDTDDLNSPRPHDPGCPENEEALDDVDVTEQDGPHKCTLCPYKSDRLYEVVDHIQLHIRKRTKADEFFEEDVDSTNRDNIYTCTECEFSCVRPEKLEAHMTLHGPGVTLECKHCGVGLASLKELRKHQKTHELDRPFVCPVCGSRFTRADNMKLHLASHDGSVEYHCRFCPYVTTYKPRLHQHHRNHMKNGHRTAALTKASVECPACSRAYTSYQLLKFHIKTHSTNLTFKCSPCGATFGSAKEALPHYADHVDSVALSCAYCDFKCFSDSTIHNHLGSQHGSHRPFQCESCDFRFSSYAHWKRHQLVHSGEKPFECDVCRARFCASGNRKAHMIKIHGYFIPLPRGRQSKKRERAHSQQVLYPL